MPGDTRRFVELYSFGVVGAALTTIALSFAHALGRPDSVTVGASGGVFAILIAFGVVFGENEILMIPFPISLKAKYFVAILIVVTLAFAIQGGGNVAYVAHLGGLFFGYIYVKFVPRSGLPRLGCRSVTMACAMAITAGSGAGRPENLKSTCGNMTAPSPSTNRAITFRQKKRKRMADRNQDGSTKIRQPRSYRKCGD